MAHNSNSKQVALRAALLGAFAGSVVGVGVGLLLAPERGEKARRRLAYHLDHLAEKVSDYVGHLGRGEYPSEARQSGTEVVEEAKKQAEQILRDANSLLDEVQRQHEEGQGPDTGL